MPNSQYAVGDVVSGKLLNTVVKGRFVALEPGLDAMLLRSTIDAGGWASPEDLGAHGGSLAVRILHMAGDRITVAPAEPGPAGIASKEELLARLAVGMRIQGRLMQTVPGQGRYVSLGYGLDGLMYIGHLQDMGIRDPESMGKMGDPVSLEVVEIIPSKGRVRLVPTASDTEGRDPVVDSRPATLPAAAKVAPQPAALTGAALQLIVDGSNLAWRDQVVDFAHLEAALEELRRCFAGAVITTVVDASLLHELKEAGDHAGEQRLQQQIETGLIARAPSRRKADDYILYFAQAKQAVVVSRDRFDDYVAERKGVRLLKPMWIADQLCLPSTVEVHPESGGGVQELRLPG